MRLNVVCVQMNITFGDPESNFRHAEQLIQQASETKPDILVLPELWTTGYDLSRLSELADRDGIQTTSFIRTLAKQLNIHMIAGSTAKKTEQGITNTMLFVDRHGDVLGEYNKVHLFQPMNEDRYLLPGQDKGLFTLEGITCAGVICYDIRFPEWIRAHTVKGASIVFVTAEWPLARLHHWKSLLISRAIENQCFVVACNRSGSDPVHVFAGHSMIIDPWGNVLAEAGEEEALVSAMLDLQIVDEVRRSIPLFADRRPDLYGDH